jgi:hypothetical protein
MPQGFTTPGHVLKLYKSTYGLIHSPHNFSLHLKDKLKQPGLEQSHDDPYLFMSKKVVCLVYVDHVLFYAQNQEDITKVIGNFKKEMELKEEDDVAGSFGIHSVHASLPHLGNHMKKCLNKLANT